MNSLIFRLGLAGFVFVIITWLTTIVVAGLARGRLGGLTGDVYGTICETTEAVLLIARIWKDASTYAPAR